MKLTLAVPKEKNFRDCSVDITSKLYIEMTLILLVFAYLSMDSDRASAS